MHWWGPPRGGTRLLPHVPVQQDPAPPLARDISTSPSDETRGEQSAAGLQHDPHMHRLALPRNRITASSQQVPRLGEGVLRQCNAERVTVCQFVFGDASEDIV